MQQEKPDSESDTATSFPKKLVLLAGLVMVIAAAYFLLRDQLTLDALAAREVRLRELRYEHPAVAYGAAFVLYVVVTGLSLPGATVLTLAYGWFFGLVPGVVLVSIASTSGATLAFLLSRYLFRGAVERRFGERQSQFNEHLRRDGPFYLFTLRLIPLVPFFVINAGMGLTPIGTWTFWWVSQLGMLPGTAVYVYAGSSVPSLQALADEGMDAVFSPGQVTRILLALALLGLFPLVVRFALRYFGMTPAIEDVQSKHNGETKA